MKCAYELNIDVSGVRKELNSLSRKEGDMSSTFADCFWTEYKSEFTEFFGESILRDVRIMQMSHNETYSWHVDIQYPRAENGDWPNSDQGLPVYCIEATCINILLSEPCGDMTYWAYDTNLAKIPYDKTWKTSHLRNYKLIDAFEMKDKATVIDTGTWHMVKSNDPSKPRKIASFLIWPLVSFRSIIEHCRDKGVLIER
tara:strand:- start:155 stop:751 length:597 start_codon:yes stop_codon:yes gene_type:complete